MKAFDFDGVLVPDIAEIKVEQEAFEKVFLGLQPLFTPSTPWVIVTGRNDKVMIDKWCRAHFKNNLPQQIFVNHHNAPPEEHKGRVLASLSYDVFIESDAVQAQALREAGHRVILFGEFIKANLDKIK
jgi:hypothetical protein